MAIAAAMNNNNCNSQEDTKRQEEEDGHENDMVMPGFRFHPTEEELVEFYLRRKVEGKRFNVELITFLDLYRYDPWELPALAAIGEKEWYFYVPRDRKYRNGDRPNRVTTSGYWKATGADRMIRSENSRPIGLKKTLVFYSGKAPKGIRTSWIMNEYRLPQHETERLQKAEISLCRVYKRAGVEDHPSLPRNLPTKAPSSSSHGPRPQPPQNRAMEINNRNFGGSPQQAAADPKINESSPSSSTDLALSQINHQPQIPTIFSTNSSHPAIAIDDLHKLVNNYEINPHQQQINHGSHHHYSTPNTDQNIMSHFAGLQQQNMVPVPGPIQAAFPDRLWDWNGIQEVGKDYTNLFK